MSYIVALVDDLEVITEKEEHVVDSLDNAEGNLPESGPTISYNKTTIMIRHPLSEETLMTGEVYELRNRNIRVAMTETK